MPRFCHLPRKICKIVKDLPVPQDAFQSTLPTSVIDRARRGDSAAFQKITLLYSGLVYHWCRTAGLSPEDSEDVGQRVFLSISRSIGGFQREKSGDSFRGWLRVVARSRIVDHFREQANRELAIGGTSFLEHVASIPETEEVSADESLRETNILYERAVHLLHGEFSEQDCKAFQLLVVDGLTPKEVAEKVGVSINSVYIAKSRILKRMRDEFEDLMGFD